MQAVYAKHYRSLWDRHWWWRSREALLLDVIEEQSQTTSIDRILDIGCGDGLFFDALARFGEVDGLEPDESLLTPTPHRTRITVGTLGSVQFSTSYDLVLMLDVLEHIEYDRDALAAARTALRPGGILILTVPALPWLWSRHDEANAHFRRYKPEGLREVLTQSGFTVDSIRFFFLWTIVPMWIRKRLQPGGAGTADYEVSIPPMPINRALTFLSKAEHAVGRRVRWPIGSSLLAVARNSEAPAPLIL